MADWRQYLRLGREQAARVPALAWMIAGVVAVAFAVVLALTLSGPPYVALYEGLSPAQGGKVIAQLQKLGIPYQLQAAGNIILVPAPQLAEARLQLGQAQVPESDSASGWDKLENAPMTTSDARGKRAGHAGAGSVAGAIDRDDVGHSVRSGLSGVAAGHGVSGRSAQAYRLGGDHRR